MGNKTTKEIEENINVVVKDEPRFTKDKLLKAHFFADRKDIVNVVVDNGETLTIVEVEERVAAFLKKEVK